MKRGQKKGSDWRNDKARHLRSLRRILEKRADGYWWPLESMWNGRKRSEVK